MVCISSLLFNLASPCSSVISYIYIYMYDMKYIGHVVSGIPTNALQRSSFFSNAKYNIGGHVYSLNDIEHGILRGIRFSAQDLLSQSIDNI